MGSWAPFSIFNLQTLACPLLLHSARFSWFSRSCRSLQSRTFLPLLRRIRSQRRRLLRQVLLLGRWGQEGILQRHWNRLPWRWRHSRVRLFVCLSMVCEYICILAPKPKCSLLVCKHHVFSYLTRFYVGYSSLLGTEEPELECRGKVRTIKPSLSTTLTREKRLPSLVFKSNYDFIKSGDIHSYEIRDRVNFRTEEHLNGM